MKFKIIIFSIQKYIIENIFFLSRSLKFFILENGLRERFF